MTNVTIAHRARLSLSLGITITPAIPSEDSLLVLFMMAPAQLLSLVSSRQQLLLRRAHYWGGHVRANSKVFALRDITFGHFARVDMSMDPRCMRWRVAM